MASPGVGALIFCGKMSKAKPPQHRGQLSAAHIARGINAAPRNARRLSDDAVSPLEIDRYPSATALATLSIESSTCVFPRFNRV